MSTLTIDNQTARRLWLSQNLIGTALRDPLDIIRALGFLQIDTIRNVARAQDHILWTRMNSYREEAVWQLLKARDLFEHFTHDASLIPSEVLPYWTRRFQDLGARAARASWYQSGLGQEEIARIQDRIEAEGPLSTRAFDSKIEGPREMWARPPHKKALDQMWYAGRLGTSHRVAFEKFYDLGARVFGGDVDHGVAEEERADWLHHAALDRIGFGTAGEIARFWDITRPGEVKAWCEGARLIPVDIETAEGTHYSALAHPDIEARLNDAPEPGQRIRILNPFDPMIRDRARTERLFGFAYRNEMFVPAPKRQFGYYVYPILEGTRFVARIEIKADRATGALLVTGYWPEPGVRQSAARTRRLDAELDRFRRFAGLSRVDWACPRTP